MRRSALCVVAISLRHIAGVLHRLGGEVFVDLFGLIVPYAKYKVENGVIYGDEWEIVKVGMHDYRLYVGDKVEAFLDMRGLRKYLDLLGITDEDARRAFGEVPAHKYPLVVTRKFYEFRDKLVKKRPWLYYQCVKDVEWCIKKILEEFSGWVAYRDLVREARRVGRVVWEQRVGAMEEDRRLEWVAQCLARVIGEMERMAQRGLERVLIAWQRGEPAKSTRFSTDGKVLFFEDLPVLRKVTGGVEVSNQGVVSEEMKRALNDILTRLGLMYMVEIMDGRLVIHGFPVWVKFVFPRGKGKWIVFDSSGRLVSKLKSVYEELGRDLPLVVVMEFSDYVRKRLRERMRPDQIMIPGTNMSFKTFYDKEMSSEVAWVFGHRELEDILKSDPLFVFAEFKKAINRACKEGKIDIEKAAGELQKGFSE